MHLTAPQLELLIDLVTHPQMYVKRFSRWAKTAFVLERLGLAVVDSHGGHDEIEVKGTSAARTEAQRRGIIPAAKKVVLIGSTTYPDAFAQVGKTEALAGNIVMGPWSFERELDDDTAARLVAAHLDMIGLADEVIVVAVGGYVGQTTRDEIDFAERSGKPVRFTDPTSEAGRG